MIDYRKRIVLLEDEIERRSLDSFLITNETNVSYLSGFEGRDSLLLFTPNKRFFITDSRYIEEAEESVKGEFEMILVASTTYQALKELIERYHLRRIGYESMNLPFEVVKGLKGSIGNAKLVPIKNLVEGYRSIKDREEIRLIKNSIALTKGVLSKILKRMKPGVSERSLSDEIEIEFIKNGSRSSFTPIVASGKNSSKPHAKPSDVKLTNKDFVMVDMGCNLNGYNSDITRMVLMGKVKDKFKRIYNIVLEAQRRALAKIRPGNKISEVDLAARACIEEGSFGKGFGHSVGHGIGMEVHEEPSISKINQDVLKPGMVFTVEPAIYLPKFGGVRLEDIVLVTDYGHEVLTR